MVQNTIKVVQDFSKYPAGRYYEDGDYSAQKFRNDLLLPALTANSDAVTVELDGVAGYSSSFLEEAFGGLVRESKLPKGELEERLSLVSADKNLIEEIRQYIREA